MTIVEVNGQEIEFPDDMAPDQIKAVLQKKFPPSDGQKKMGKLEAAARGFEESTSFGLTDELRGFGRAVGSMARGDERSFPDLLDRGIREVRDEYGRAKSQRPGSTLSGELAGAIVPLFTAPGQTVAARIGAGGLKQSAAKGAGAGAASGGLYGFGSAEGDIVDRIPATAWGGALGAGFGAGVPAALHGATKLNTRTIIPNADQIRSRAGELYRSAEKSGGVLKPEFTNKFVDSVERMKPQTDIGLIVGGDDAFTKVAARIAQIRDRPMTLQGAQELDELLGDAIDGFTEMGRVTKQGKKLLDIQTTLRNMIDDADEGMISGGRQGFDAIKEARNLWSTSYRLNDIERILQRADQYDQPATAIKTGFRTLLNNPNKMRGYSSEEIKAMRKAAESGVISDLLRTAGSRLPPIITAASGGGLGATAAAAAGSMASRNMATAAQASRAGAAARKVAERSGMVQTEKRLQLPSIQELLKMPAREGLNAINKGAAKPLALPAPQYADDFVVDSLGNVRKASTPEKAVNKAARERELMLGMDPGTRLNAIRHEARAKFGPAWDAIDQANQQRIAKEVEQAYRSNPRASLSDLIDQSLAKSADIAAATGEAKPTGALAGALLRAKATPKK